MNFKSVLLFVCINLLFISCETQQDISPLPDTPPLPVTDIDGNVYKTVKIGTQIWMAENLKVTKSNEGDTISSYAYNYEPSYINTYGRLYDWQTALEVCPKGWRLPNDQDWFILLTCLDNTIKNPISTGYLGEETAGQLKSIIGWVKPNVGATNSTGFSALPSGSYYQNAWYDMGYITSYWSSTDSGIITLEYKSASVFKGYSDRYVANCVRCIKD